MLKNNFIIALSAIVIFFGLMNNAVAQNYLPYNYWTMDGVNPLKDSMNRSDLDPTYFASAYSINNSGSSGVGKCIGISANSNKIIGSNTLPLDTGFTVEFLVRFDADINETVSLIARRDGAVNIRFGYPDMRFTTKIIPTGSTTATSENFDIDLDGLGRASYGYYMDGKFHHMVFRYNAKTGQKDVWVDGQLPEGFSDTLLAPGLFPANTATPNSNICDLNTAITYYKFFGDMDEIAIYNYALPDKMIYKHFTEVSQNHHYSFSNSTVPVPAADAVTGPVDPLEYAPGHPVVNVDPLEQLKSFPTPRYKPNHTLPTNVPVFNPAYLSGQGLGGLFSYSEQVNKSKQFQREFVTNYNYSLVVATNTGSSYQAGDTNTFTGAWIKMGNDNPTWKTSANMYWPDISPASIGKTSIEPYAKCGCLPNSSYMRNSAGNFIDRNGNVITGKVLSPEAPLDSIRFDGLTQRNNLSQIFSKMTRPLNFLFENGEMITHYATGGLNADPLVSAAKAASGMDDRTYVGNRMRRFTDAYTSQFLNLSQLSNTRFIHYQITGNPSGWEYGQTRTISSIVNGEHYPTGDVYTGNPRNWRYRAGDYNGWQYVVDSRFVEYGFGDSLNSPTVSPGWSYDEERYARPGQWLGLLKAIAATGATNFQTGFFVTAIPPQLPQNYVWQMVYPSYVQAITSRYEDLLRNGHILEGDVMKTQTGSTDPGYSFKAGDMRKLIVARKHNSQNKYLITGTIQPNSNMAGNADLEDVAAISLDGQSLKFNIRRQGSTYIYDNTVPSAPVFYQLDGWHEYKHPSYWSKSFDLEAELYDNTAPVTIKTKVPTGTPAGNFTNYTSYISFNSAGTVEYNFQPRGSVIANHYLWVMARSKDGSAQSFTVSLDGANTHTIGCVQDTNWKWYRFDATTNLPITFNNLSLQNHTLSVTCSNTRIEIDKITVTPASGTYYTANVAGFCNIVGNVASIITSGSTTFCQGDSVILTANSGTSYLWSNGATTQSIKVTSSGSYIVSVTNGAILAVSLPEIVTVNPKPSNNVSASGPTSFCAGGSVTLTASNATGTYYWTPDGLTARAITVSDTGNYQVTITNANGCTAISPVTTVSIGGTGTPATITPSGSTSICQGSNVSLTANTGISYLWSTGATTKTITTNTAGNYAVTVTYSGGCSATSPVTSVTVNPIPSNGVTASGPTTFCSGGSVTLTANYSTGTYLWSPGGQTTRAITVSAAGNYSVIVTSAGNCSSTSAVTSVTISGSGTPASITPSGNTTFCQGGTVNLTANSGTSYLWSNGATTRTITANATGNYLVTVTYTGGCNSTSPVTAVTVNPLPLNTVSASGPTTFCTGGSVTLTADYATGTYVWSPGGQTARSINVTTAGNYSVVVTGTGSCSSTSAVTTVTISGSGTPATITPSGATTFCQGGSVNLTANSGSSYLWSNGATTRTIAASATGNYSVTVTYTGGCTSTSSVTAITVNPLPLNTVSASGPTTFCTGGSVTLTADYATGTYVWSPGGQTARSINVTTAGNYSVVVTGTGSCSSTSAVTTVTISGSGTPATITPSGATTFCQGGSVNLTANSGSSYLWSNGATTRTIAASATGNYSVTVTYTGGCTSTSSVTAITVNPLPLNTVSTSGPTTFCSGGSVTLTADYGTGTYVWSPGGQTTRSINVTSAGNYSVVVTGTGSCSATSAVTTVTISGSGTPATITPSGNTTFCQGGNVNLTANLGSNYLWSNGATTRTISANATGNYSVMVTYTGGCTSTSSVTAITVNPLPLNTVTPSGPTTFCTGGSVTLTADYATGTYVWSPGGQTTRSINVATAGNYSVVVTGTGSCSSTSAVTTVTISGSGTPATITSLGSTTFCQGGNVTLTANVGNSYLWSTGATTNSINTTTSGNYFVTVTYGGGCSSTSPAMTVTVNPLPVNTVTPSGSTTFCSGGSVTLTADNATGTYVWSPGGQTTRSINVTSAGNYSVVVTGTGNCSATSPVTTVTISGSGTPASITSSGSTTFCEGGSVDLTANLGNSYLWSNGATTRTITASSPGNYSVTVTYSGGCTSTSPATTVTVNSLPSDGVTPSGSTTFCNGGSVILTADNPTGSYLWSPGGQTTRSITVSTAGNYSVVVTSGNCSVTSAVTTVTITGSGTPASITASGNTTFCNGGNVTLTANAGSSYLWSNGATTNSINASNAGNYSVIVTYSGGCTSASPATTIIVRPRPGNGVTLSGPTTFCNGGSVTFAANNSTGTYLWSPGGQTTRSIVATTSGNYFVTISNIYGCSRTSQVIPVSVGSGTPATITASGATTFCQGGSVNLTATSGNTYLWSNGATTRTISANATGNYVVTVDFGTGCNSVSPVTSVTVNPIPSNTVSASGPTTFCNGGSVTLTSNSANGTYLWSPGGQTTRSIIVTTSGNYVVTATNNGCSSTSNATTVSVGSGTALPTPVITTSRGVFNVCEGSSINLTTVAAAPQYLWSTGETTRSIDVSSAGNYSVAVSNGSGCSTSSSAVNVTYTTRPNFTVTVSGPLSFCVGNNVTFFVSPDPAFSYVWYKNNIQIPGANASSYTAYNAGDYRVRVQKNGCPKNSGTGHVTTPCREGEELTGENDIQLNAYPNPFANQTTLSFVLPTDDQVTVKIFDMEGRLVNTLADKAQMMEGPVEINYDASALRKGMYYATVTTGSAGSKSIKISSLK